ncbi:MAG: flagellar hook-associated protein FlgK [Bacillota bacterium]
MRSTFFGFEAARKALMAQQRSLDVTSHNIANANTEGYSRQRAELTTTTPYTIPGMKGQVGTGVEVSTVNRIREEFADFQFRSENQALGKWETYSQALERVEGIFAEPTSSGLKKAIGEFFNAWQELSKDGGNETVRALVRQRGIAMTDMFHHLNYQLEETRLDLNEGIELAVKDINGIADQIASLNGQIYNSELTGYTANDLRDRRDLLVDKLSSLVNVRVQDDSGQYSVLVGGTRLVSHTSVVHMEAVPMTTGDDAGMFELQWENNGTPVQITSGQLSGYLQVRNDIREKYMDELDNLAVKMVDEINAKHQGGWAYAPSNPADPSSALIWQPGEAFFDPTKKTAKGIEVSSLILNETIGLKYIAAASGPTPVQGDGSNALALAQLRNTRPSGGDTYEHMYESMLGTLGVQAQYAERLTDNQTFLTEQLQNRRNSVSGVSLDEEMTNMIKFQHAYNAAARVTTVMDEVLDTLINRLGAR